MPFDPSTHPLVRMSLQDQREDPFRRVNEGSEELQVQREILQELRETNARLREIEGRLNLISNPITAQKSGLLTFTKTFGDPFRSYFWEGY